MNYQRLNLANFLGKIAKIDNNLCLTAASYLLLNLGASASAQVIPDNTLPNNSLVNQNGNLIEILEGTTAGNNLFHSFEQFSIIQGETAWFNNATTIDNIITRVTGSSLSSIDGLLRANGTANLFFLNPNGIIFGPNAQLNIGGSFVGSTADSLQFSDGSEFSAIDPQAPPLLTVSINPGLQYGIGNGNIAVQGEGNLLAFNNPVDLIVDRSARPGGLEVDTGKTLALVGNNIFVEGGNLTAEAGNIELGSVGDNSLVQLNSTDSGWNLDYSEVSNFQDIILSQASSLEVSGNNGGDVQLQGRQVIITDGSAILADTFGDRDAGTLKVNASELLVVAGTSENLPFISRLSTDVAPVATGNGGDIELNASSLIVTGGAQVLSSSYSGSNTGNIKVTAEDVELSSGSPIARSSGLFTLVFGSGNGGDIDIEANSMSVLGGAQAAALTFGIGKGGNLNVNANSLDLNGTSPGGFSSSLATNSQGPGDGGNLTINSEYLLVANGGVVQSSVFGSGNGGNLVVKATEVELLSGAPGVGSSGLFANVEVEATGNGGNLSIDTQSLLIADGAQAAINNRGSGDTSTLDVKANEILLKGTSPGSFASGLFSNTEPEAIGNAGQIIINTQKLQITDGAEIASTTLGSGAGGSVQINADEIELIGGVPGSASGLFTVVQFQAEGNGGDLKVETDSLKITEGAQIAVSTAGSGNGGGLEIIANQVELIGGSELGASGIFGNAVSDDGNGGNITVTTNDLTIRDGATINVSNFLNGNVDDSAGTGEAGSININAQTITVDGVDSSITAATFAGSGGNIILDSSTMTVTNSAQVTAETLGAGDGGSITISADEFNLNNQAQVSVDSIGSGRAGNITVNIDSDIALANNSQITSESQGDGNGGNIELTANSLELKSGSLLSSNTSAKGDAGSINLTVETANFSDSGTGIFSEVEATATGDGGSIAISANDFNLNNQAQVSVNSTGEGQAGNIAIAVADNLTLDEGNITATNGAQVTVETSEVDDGGSITLSANELNLNNQAQVSVDSLGAGRAGDITVNIDSDIALANNSQITSESQGDGNGGNIELTANSLELKSGSLLSSNTSAKGDAGSINLTVETANFSDSGTGIFSEVEETATGDGGNIEISANDFNLNNQAQVSVNSRGEGQAGNIAISSDSLNLDEGNITATSTQTGGGDLSIVTNSLSFENDSLISTSVLDSTGGGGNILIDNGGFIIGKNNSDIKADAVFGPGGNIQINAQGIFFDLDSEITASSQFGTDGVVEINISESDKQMGVVPLASDLVDPTGMVSSFCSTASTDTMIISGKGGLGENPSQNLRGQSVWEDLRDFSLASNNDDIEPTASQNHNSETIIEANNWLVNAQGKVELVSQVPVSFNQCKK